MPEFRDDRLVWELGQAYAYICEALSPWVQAKLCKSLACAPINKKPCR